MDPKWVEVDVHLTEEDLRAWDNEKSFLKTIILHQQRSIPR